MGKDCSTDLYTKSGSNSFRIIQSGTDFLGLRIPTEANAVCPLSGPISCDLTIKGNPNTMVNGYNVLATDYSGYLITYGCTEMMFDLVSSPYLWIHTKEKVMTTAQREEVFGIIAAKLPNYKTEWLTEGKQGVPFCDYTAKLTL
jgi:hypothetical protein